MSDQNINNGGEVQAVKLIKSFDFVRLWETAGGQILLLVILALAFSGMYMAGMKEAWQIVGLVVGALLGILKGEIQKPGDSGGQKEL